MTHRSIVRAAVLLAALSTVACSLAGPPERDLAVRAAGDRMLVVLRATAGAGGGFLRLEEIADLPNDPHRIRDRVRGLLLGLAPAEGEMREVRAVDVSARLAQAGVPERAFLVTGADRSKVFLGTSEAGELARHPADADAPAPPPGLPARPARKLAAPAPSIPPAGRERPSPAAGAPPRPAPAASPEDSSRGGVEKGAGLIIRTSGPALLLEERGRASACAGPGEMVEVVNQRTGKKLMARVLGPGVVAPAAESGGSAPVPPPETPSREGSR